MLDGIEGESINDDELFGSGPAQWNGSSDIDLRLGARYEPRPMVHIDGGRMDHVLGSEANEERNNVQAPTTSNGARPRLALSEGNVSRPQAGTAGTTVNTRDPVVRNKTNKNKENKSKNVNNQRRQLSDVYDCDSRSRQEEASPAEGFRPVLQVKRHNIEQADRKSKNTVKQEKQSKNNSIAAAQGSSENPASMNGYRDTSHLLMNGIDPQENPRNISAIYVRHRPHAVHNTHQRTNRVDSNEFSLGADLSPDNDDNETTVKAVNKNNIKKIKNDLRGKKKQENSDVNLPSLNLQGPSLDLSFSNSSGDLETDHAPNASPTVIQRSSPSVSQSHDLFMQSPIVVPYNPENSTPPCNNQINSALLMQNNGLALSLSNSGQLSPSVVASDSLLDSFQMPTSCYFGDGHSDSLYAQRLQQLYERGDMDSDLIPRGLDIGPNRLHYHDNLHNEPTLEPEANAPDHIVYTERIHNDLYEPTEDDHSCGHLPIELEPRIEVLSQRLPEGSSNNIALPEPDGVRIRDGHLLSDQLYHETDHHMAVPLLPSSDAITPEPDYSVHEGRGTGVGGGEMAEGMDDEAFARMLQDQLDLEQLTTEDDEQYARYLQDMEDDDRYRERYRGHRERGTHQPLHTRYGRTWSRPLRVGQQSSDQNVMDSRIARSQGTWDRPLQQRGAGGGGGAHGGNDFAFLETVHDLPVREGYDIPPGGYNFYRNEYDPDFIYDDRGEDYLVSININRDPHMLASLLMERAPDMMVPNDIDLNDYEALWELAEGLGEVRRVGMEQTEISLLPVHTYQPPAGGESENSKTDCLVCLNTFAQGEKLRTLPCCHIYHVDCIDEWLKRNAICPVCRQAAKQGGH